MLSNPAYPNHDLTPPDAIDLLEQFRSDVANHVFLADDLSLTDSTYVSRIRIQVHKQITDTYLLALCKKHGATLVTFDRRLSSHVVQNAPKDVIVFIS